MIPQVSSSLIRIFGEDNVRTTKADLIASAKDASGISGSAHAVVFPRSEEQVRKAIVLANQRRYPLVARGGGTSLTGAAVPNGAIVIDFSRMDRMIRIDVRNSEATVEPGVIVDDLNAELAQFGLFFPVIPSSHEVCTIGGMIATDAAGIYAHRYGKAGVWVSGMKVIDGTGKSYTFNGTNDFIGSEGIFGMITEIKLRLAPAVAHDVDVLVRCRSREDMLAKVREAVKDDCVLSIEFLDPYASSLIGLGDRYHLILGKSEGKGTDGVAELRKKVPIALDQAGYRMTTDPFLPEDKLAELLIWLNERKVPCFGHIGYGIIHARFMAEQEHEIEEMFQRVEEMGGLVAGEHGIGLTRKKYLDSEKAALMKGLKYMYDPENIMNPGKVI